MSTITTEQQQAIRDYLADRHIPAGIGTEEEACSIAAINLVLSGRLTDDIPECMSPVIGRWIVPVQDAMPDSLRNSPEWRNLLPLAAGTGRDPAKEKARLSLILDWMWGTVLPTLQPLADKQGFGEAWSKMTTERTEAAAAAAAWAAVEEAAVEEARAARAAAAAAWAAAAAARAAAWAAARAATWAAARADFWSTVNPVGLLARLVELETRQP